MAEYPWEYLHSSAKQYSTGELGVYPVTIYQFSAESPASGTLSGTEFAQSPFGDSAKKEKTSVVLPGTQAGTQMSQPWIRVKIDEMLLSTDEEVRRIGRILDENEDLIERYVLTIDTDLKQVIIVKLDTF